MQGLTLIPLNDVPIIHARLKGVNRPIPIQLMGEGLNRMLGLFLAMNDARGGLVLIDEIENGLYAPYQGEVFASLVRLAAVYDVQVFATTHSYEFLERAHNSIAEDFENDIVYYRIDRGGSHLRSVRFDRKRLETALHYNMEIR